MKDRFCVFVLLVLALGWLSSTLSGDDNIVVTLDAEWIIDAGEAWEVLLRVEGVAVGEAISVMLVNGLNVIDAELTLGTGGVALWRVPRATITHAGASVFSAHIDGHSVQRQLSVRPHPPESVDLFATRNSITAYGREQATFMLLPRDTYGNPPSDDAPFALDLRYPDGTSSRERFAYAGGLGHLTLSSQGTPGRLRLRLAHAELDAALEIMQTPAEPHAIRLNVEPRCALSDGRDRFTLRGYVTDAYGQAVADGTLVRFIWHDGLAYGRSINGQASVRLPVPTSPGWKHYQARAGTTPPVGVLLRVVDVQQGERCPDAD